MDTTITHQLEKRKVFSFNIISHINNAIERETINAIGISVALIMLGTCLASITVALSASKGMFILLMLCASLAMGANVMALSQRSFKTVVWSFIINVGINFIALIYLVSLSV
jgi:hypothetical protein